VKLYADEAGSAMVRRAGHLVVSAVTRVEVVSALWRKVATGQLDEADAVTLVREFEADWSGDGENIPRFTSVAVSQRVLSAAAALVPVHRLRAYDAVVLASALAVRDAVPDARLLAWDHELAAAAAREGLPVAGG